MKKLDQSLSSINENNNNGHLKQLLFVAATLSLLLLVLVFGTSSSSYVTTAGGGGAAAGHSTISNTNIYRRNTTTTTSSVASKGRHQPPPVVLAYWIYGSTGDGDRILRLLKATYHPRNHYLLFLDSSSSSDERARLALSVQSHPLFSAFDNVNVVGRAYAVNHMGGSGLSALLHASALLLKLTTTWDWFIPLSASHYPLMTQDDILLAFTSLPRDLNFVHFTNITTQSHEDVWVKQVVVDPSVYNIKTGPIFKAKETRNPPNTFKILQGSPWVILSRPLIDFCVKGWDNFPRKLLMYMTNIASPLEFYFQTLICNSPRFHNTTIDNHLRYVMTKSDSGKEVLSKAGEMPILARPFKSEDDVVLLQEIDKNILNRSANGVVPGKWCLEQKTNATTNVTEGKVGWRWEDINSVEATPRGVKLGRTLSRLASEGIRRFDGCPTPNNVLKR